MAALAGNCLVLPPMVWALLPGWGLAAVVIVVQSLVELIGMVLFLWWVPRRLFPLRPMPAGGGTP